MAFSQSENTVLKSHKGLLFWFNLIKKDFTAAQVYNIIKNNYLDRDDLDNHNEPQYKFIVDENSELIKDITPLNI